MLPVTGSLPLFEFDDVVVRRGRRRVLDGVNARVPACQVTAVVGPSGSGKSTMLRLCNGLSVPSSGAVLRSGEDLALADRTVLRRQVGMVFQRPVLLPGTIEDNLRAAVPDAVADDLEQSLLSVGLTEPLNRDAASLSGGEAQRMCLARTLLTDPDVVLFDEPTSALDPAATSSIEALARGLVADGKSCLWVTHDLDQMRAISDHVLFVDGGKVLQQGSFDVICAAPCPAFECFLGGER